MIGVFFGLTVSLVTATAYAQISTGIPPISTTSALSATMCNILNAMFWVLIAVSIIMIFWGAYLYVISEGKPERPSTARLLFLYAAMGIIAAFLAKGAPLLIASVFGPAESAAVQTYQCP
jgi:hypothetical protein